MIGIASYFGGEVLHGLNGAYYSTQPSKMFNISPDLDFRGITREVYQQVGIDPNYYELVISARINIGQGNQTWFQQLPVQDNNSWGLYTQMTMNLTTPFKFLELYIVANSRQNPRRNPNRNTGNNSRQNIRPTPQLTQGRICEQSVTIPGRALTLGSTSRSPSVGARPSRSQPRVPSTSSSRA